MITRVKFSDSVKFFEQGFKERWGLSDYNPDEPALFVGAYSEGDIQNIINHRGPKVVMIAGADMPNISRLKHYKSIVRFIAYNVPALKEWGVPYFDGIIPIKSYEKFKPCKRGDKIYLYTSTATRPNEHKYGLDTIPDVIKYFGRDRFIFGVHGKNEEQLIEDNYKPSFINLQLNPHAGYSTAIEMACMGRRSVSNAATPFALPYKSQGDIIDIISAELLAPVHGDLIGDFLCNDNNWLEI